MDKMTLISPNHTAANEVKRSVPFKREKEKRSDLGEIAELRYKLNKSKNDIVELVAKHNEELSSCDSQLAKLRSEVEKGEAIRQSLEYELAVARKQCSVERLALEEENANSLKRQEYFKAQIKELQRKIYSMEQHFQTTQFSWQDAQKTIESDLQIRDHAIEDYKKEQDILMLEKNKLEALNQKQNMVIQELKQKLHELDIEKNSHMDTVRRQKSELGFSLEREGRLKQELEAANQRVKKLGDNIEAERAAHLESKFNSEIIQLRIRDLEGSLQVESASQAQSASDLELIKNQFRDVEIAYNREKGTAEELSGKLQKLEKEYSFMDDEFKAQIEKKNKLIMDLSGKVKHSEESFATMQHDFAVTKNHQLSLEEAYGRYMKELQTLVDSFNVSSYRVSGTYNDKAKPAGPAVLEALRHTLTDYHNKLECTSNELETRKRVCAEMKEELDSSKQMIQSLRKNLENTQSEQMIVEKDLNHLSANYAERESQIAQLQIELEKAKDAWEKEKRRALESGSAIQKTTRAFQKDKEEKLTFLHHLYQRLVAGCVLIKQPECMLGSFSWPELSVVLQENVDVLISDLNQANKKMSHLEDVCKNKADVIRDQQQDHEDSLDKLAEQMKAQQSAWEKKTRDLEHHYSALLGEVHARAQKYQRIAEKLKDKISIFEKTKDKLALENVNIKNLLINTEKDHKSLLAACALMAGALYSLYSRSSSLAAQRNILQDQMNTYVDVQNEIRKLVQALSDNEVKKNDDSKRIRKPPRCMKHVFRQGVIVVLAANRLQHLGRSSRSLFTWMASMRRGPGILVCPGGTQTKHKILRPHDKEIRCQEAWKWLTSADLLSAVVSAMSELLSFLNKKDANSRSQGQIIDTARNCFSKLMNKLNVEMETRTVGFDRSSIYEEPDSLVHRLARGLHRINFQTSSTGLKSTTPIMKCLAALKKQILAFTQRLHTAEVERRSLRLELSDIKKKISELRRNTDNTENLKEQLQQSKVVPYDKFKTAFEELNNALLREQEAQILLHEQSQQLLELNYKIELHSKEEAEKDQTLSEAIKGVSEAKMEMQRKDQLLRQQNRKLTQLEQDKHRLEESISSLENALRVAAKDKEVLTNYMISFAAVFQKIRDQISLLRAASTRHDFTLQLPKLTPKMFEIEGYMGGAEFTACQSMIRCFLDIYQIAYTKTTALEREITFHKNHIAALKSELQIACLRENKSLSPMKYDSSVLPITEFLSERSIPDFLPLQAEQDLSNSHMNYSHMNSRLFQPIDHSSATGLTQTTMQELPNKM